MTDERPLTPAANPTAVVLTCMDPRIDLDAVLGTRPGDLVQVRVAGGRATPDAVASVTSACALFGLRTVHVIHHTDCGMHRDPGAVRSAMAAHAGVDPDEVDVDLPFIDDPAAALDADVAALRDSGLLAPGTEIRAATLDLATGRLIPHA